MEQETGVVSAGAASDSAQVKQELKCGADYRRLSEGFASTFMSGWAERRQCSQTGHNALYSRVPIKAGAIICDFSYRAMRERPNYLTVQVGEGKHIELQPQWLEHINNSCEPNVIFNTTTFKLEALRDIEPGEEFCFFYPATEWSMDSPFECRCGTPSCIGYIAGAAHLSREQLSNYRLTDFIANRCDERDASASAGSPSSDSS